MSKRHKRPAKRGNAIELVQTGVPGLDTVLGGGLVANGLYLIEGMAGAGKTILSSQICFNQIRDGRKVLFVTLIAESHAKLLQHLESMSFYDPEALSRSFVLISGYDALSSNGLQGFLELIARSVKEHSPSFLVVDGFRTTRQVRESELGLSEFLHQLNAFITGARCTTVLLAPFSGSEPHPEHTLVDGLIELNNYASGMRRTRELEVHKLRAANHMRGRHTFEITSAGINVFPRLEALQLKSQPQGLDTKARLEFGIPALDDLIGGGLVARSATVLLGPPGAGKTIMGLKFLEAGIRNDERCLYFGFYEPPERLIGKARQVGIRLAPALKTGALQIMWQPPVEQSLDESGHLLLKAVREHNVRRVFVDGIEGFRDTAVRPERVTFFMAALTNHLKGLDTTTVFSEEVSLYSADFKHTAFGVSAVIENIVLLRYAEVRAQLHRLISIVKLRESHYDTDIHEFSISASGVNVSASSTSVEDMLTGQPAITAARSRPAASGRGKIGAANRGTARK